MFILLVPKSKLVIIIAKARNLIQKCSLFWLQNGPSWKARLCFSCHCVAWKVSSSPYLAGLIFPKLSLRVTSSLSHLWSPHYSWARLLPLKLLHFVHFLLISLSHFMCAEFQSWLRFMLGLIGPMRRAWQMVVAEWINVLCLCNSSYIDTSWRNKYHFFPLRYDKGSSYLDSFVKKAIWVADLYNFSWDPEQ